MGLTLLLLVILLQTYTYQASNGLAAAPSELTGLVSIIAARQDCSLKAGQAAARRHKNGRHD